MVMQQWPPTASVGGELIHSNLTNEAEAKLREDYGS
jgi:hypothetical protein